jgi:hypothetical protein
MDVEVLRLVGDIGVSGLLALVLWQGLKRFDRLLSLVIMLAAQSKLSTDEVEKIRAQVFGENGASRR